MNALEKAIYNYTIYEIKSYVIFEEEMDSDFSEISKRRIKKEANSIWRKVYAPNIRKNVAIAVVSFIIISGAFLMFSPQTRAYLEYLMENFTDHIDVMMHTENMENDEFSPMQMHWIPQDFKLESEQKEEGTWIQYYKNEEGEDLIFMALEESGYSSTSLDNEGHKVWIESINGYECIMSEPVRENATYSIMFAYNGVWYNIDSSACNLDTLRKIVENME